MNQLLDKYNEYKSIINFKVEYTFEDNSQVEFKIKQTEFPHLIGLHKLIDIPIIRQFNDKKNTVVSAKFIISRIKKEYLTEEIIKNSCYFADIEDRFKYLSKDNILSMSYTDAVVDFNASIIGSSLKAKYILYEQKNKQGYNYLCIAENGQDRNYIESFFYNPTDLYIKNQKIIKVKEIRIYDNFGKMYLEDKL